jgi:hypothetical protein
MAGRSQVSGLSLIARRLRLIVKRATSTSTAVGEDLEHEMRRGITAGCSALICTIPVRRDQAR